MGAKMNDLTGKRFGQLVVIESTGKTDKWRNKLWRCQCDCGNSCCHSTTELIHKSEDKLHCSDRRNHTFGHMTDLKGQKFGRLTVLSEANKKDWLYGIRTWNCICDCGEECLACTAHLISGKKKSCGCLKTFNFRNKNLNNPMYCIHQQKQCGKTYYTVWIKGKYKFGSYDLEKAKTRRDWEVAQLA